MVMGTIESLNRQYLEQVNMLKVLSSYNEVISEERNDFSVSANERFRRSMEHLRNMIGEIDCAQFPFLSDAITIAMQYNSCLQAIYEYQKALTSMSRGGKTASSASVIAAANAVKTSQQNYDRINQSFQEKYKAPIDNVDTLNTMLGRAIEMTIALLKKVIGKIKDDARMIMDRELSTELRGDADIPTVVELPSDMLVARSATSKTPYALLRDMGITAQYDNIFNNLKSQGNVILKTPFESMSDDAIDAFVAAYIIRYIETFPLGTVNVHIVDNNASFLFRRLCNSFQSENAGEVANKVVRLYSSMDVVSTFQEVICEDIFKKTSRTCPDLYSIYETDRTDAFNLIVLRDGLVGNNGYASTEVLDAVSALTKLGGMGHRCGVRFLIVDDSESFEKSLNANVKFMLGVIQQNCNLQFEYSNGKFKIAGKTVDMLHITGDLDGYIQDRSQAIAKAIAAKEKTCISLDEVSSRETVSSNEAIIYIPVGKAGTEAVQLPLSCKDDNGTVAGQCIGYMAIGQSGSGKSSFFHSVVLNGCLKYSPKELQFWLLDFKYGGASSKYSKSGLPHIRIIAENNKIDDALCLFQMISEEMDRRNRAFNENFVDNIVDYNRIAASSDTLEYFPRVIIAIDEVQEIFREENAAVLQKLISSISVRMRSAGMHFVMVAQNLCEGKSYMLKEAFLPSASGRICFRVAQNIARDSGFSEEFSQRKQEIAELKTGEAYVSYGKGTIRKVKMAYASPEDMTGKYFAQIRELYPEYSEMKPLVIGSKQRLSIAHSLQKNNLRYFDVISGLKPMNGIYSTIIGEDAYRMEPLFIRFSQYENSAVMLLGNDKELSSSLCASIAGSLIRQGACVHLFNGDKIRIQNGYESVPHPFMSICQGASAQANAHNYKLSEFDSVLAKLYAEYLRRQSEVQKSDDDVPTFDAEFLVINDLFGIESFISNNMVEGGDLSAAAAPVQTSKYDFLSARATTTAQNAGQFKESTQTIVSNLVRNGCRYNIHIILAIKGEPSVWRNSRIMTEVNNIVLFNPTQFADHIENSYYLKEMLRNIANENGEETMAVWASKRSFSKIRPIIYKMFAPAERGLLETLIKGE